MPDFSSAFQSFFSGDNLKVSGPVALTIKEIRREEIGRDDVEREAKIVARFTEDERGIVLNKTRYDALAALFGSRDTDVWVGKRIEAFFDPTIQFGNRRIGGIALRAPVPSKV